MNNINITFNKHMVQQLDSLKLNQPFNQSKEPDFWTTFLTKEEIDKKAGPLTKEVITQMINSILNNSKVLTDYSLPTNPSEWRYYVSSSSTYKSLAPVFHTDGLRLRLYEFPDETKPNHSSWGPQETGINIISSIGPGTEYISTPRVVLNLPYSSKPGRDTGNERIKALDKLVCEEVSNGNLKVEQIEPEQIYLIHLDQLHRTPILKEDSSYNSKPRLYIVIAINNYE